MMDAWASVIGMGIPLLSGQGRCIPVACGRIGSRMAAIGRGGRGEVSLRPQPTIVASRALSHSFAGISLALFHVRPDQHPAARLWRAACVLFDAGPDLLHRPVRCRLLPDLGITASAIGALYLAGTLSAAVTLLFVGHLIDRIRLIYFSAAVIVGLAIACFVTASAAGPFTLFLAFYLLRLTGQSLMVHVEATATARAFDRERGRALGITALGIPLAEVIFRRPSSPASPSSAGGRPMR